MSTDLIGPDGKQYHIKSDDPEVIAKAESAGYKVGTAGDTGFNADDVVDTGKAALRGAVSGATFGFVNETDPTLKAAEKIKDEEHPIAHGVGELAGAVLSPINKIAAPVEGVVGATTALGRIGAKALGGAAVGGLYGAGTAVNEASLGDSQLTAEKLLSSAGLGALLGGAGGGIMTAVEEGASKVLPSLGKMLGGSKSTLEDFANDRWLKASGGIQSDIKKIPLEDHGAVADVLREHLVEPGKVSPRSLDDALESLGVEKSARANEVISQSGITDAGGLSTGHDREEALGAVENAIETHGERIGEVYGKTEEAGLRPDVEAVRHRISSLRAGLSGPESDVLEPHISRVEGYLQDLESKPKYSRGYAELNKLRSDLDAELRPIYRAGDSFQGNLRKRLVGELRDELDTQLAQQAGPDIAKELLDAKREASALYRARDALKGKNSTGLDAIRAIANEAETVPASMSRLEAVEHASNLVQHGLERKLGNRWLSASDYLTGLGSIAAGGNPILALGSSIGHKFLREKAPALIAQLADRIAASPMLATTADSFAQKLPKVLTGMGPYAQQLGAAGSPAAVLATHMVMSRADPAYTAHAQLAGLEPESPAQHQAAMGKAGDIASIAAAVKAHDETMGRQVSSMLSGKKEMPTQGVMQGQEFGSKRMRRDEAEAHDKRATEIRQLASDPQALVDRVTANTGNLSNVAPALHGAMTSLAHTAVTYLASTIQEPPKGGPLARDWAPTESERSDFAMRLEVAEDGPKVLLKHAASGTLSPVQIEAASAIYPKAMQEIANMAAQKAIARGDVPYASRFMMAMLGVDLDGTFTPESILANQVSSKLSKDKPSMAARSESDSKLTLAARTALPSQRRDLDNEA